MKENFRKFNEIWAQQELDEIWDELEDLCERERLQKIRRLIRKTEKKDDEENDITFSFRFRNVLREIFTKYTREQDMKLDVEGFRRYMKDNKVRQRFRIDLIRFNVFAVHEIKPKAYVTWNYCTPCV